MHGDHPSTHTLTASHPLLLNSHSTTSPSACPTNSPPPEEALKHTQVTALVGPLGSPSLFIAARATLCVWWVGGEGVVGGTWVGVFVGNVHVGMHSGGNRTDIHAYPNIIIAMHHNTPSSSPTHHHHHHYHHTYPTTPNTPPPQIPHHHTYSTTTHTPHQSDVASTQTQHHDSYPPPHSCGTLQQHWAMLWGDMR